MARRLISRYPRSAPGTEARDFAKAGGSRTMASNRSRARSSCRRASKTSASRHSMFVSRLSAALAAPRSSASRLAVQGHHARGPPGQMDRKRAVVGEAVEGPPAGRHQLAGQKPVRPLIEKRAGLLSRPGRREVAHRAFPHLDLPGNGSVARDRSPAKALPAGAPARRSAGASPPARRSPPAPQDGLAHGLEPGRQDLDHQPAIITVDHERRQGVPFGMDHPIGGGIDVAPAGGARGEPLAPPGRVDRAVASAPAAGAGSPISASRGPDR